MGKKRTDAAAYLRVSSAGQLDGHGLERQEEAVRAFASARGYRIVEAFRDAHTGTEEERPAFSAMLAAIAANGTRTVLIQSMDRLARSLSVQLALLSMLEREGVALIVTSTGQDVTAEVREDPMREAMVLMQGIFAQTEKKLLVRKLRNARDAKRASEGRCEGVRPFGQDPKRPDEADTVRLIRRLRRRSPKTGKRRGYGAIATELTRYGVPTRKGGPWSRSTVRDVLARPTPS